MRSFTNKKGDNVTVSKDHLDMAVKIKLELQKASPSRKCSWSQLVKLMKKEGYEEAENSENYRCLVKAYQKSIGELPEAPKYADMVADSKIESIKELVGEISYEKRENQHVLRQLNKVKRDVIDFTLIAEQIGKAFSQHDWSKLILDNSDVKSSKKKMIVNLSDLHIGAIVNNDINTYNFKIATRRILQYMNRVIYDCKMNGITDVYVMNLGDSIEHPYMHNLMYNSEFVLSEQILNASDLIIKFLLGLANAGINVTTAGIAGNHDRFNEKKDVNLDGDHAVKGINKAIASFVENAKPKRIKYEQAKDYEHSFTVNGKNILALHGDLDNKDDKNLISKHSDLKGISYDIVLMGHYHTREVKELGDNKFIVLSGSTKGADNFVVNKLRKISSPSQTYLIIHEYGEIEVKWVTLI